MFLGPVAYDVVEVDSLVDECELFVREVHAEVGVNGKPIHDFVDCIGVNVFH